ncbi:unnamed protein product [Brassica oleracea]|uniref:Uncharacterized protein n=1 Tax=Brassica oleracea TaxID=3712 RepID=A0A3P6FG14_BRAOL|nr:unnamed protein product [Brassica oleracea]
MSSKGESSSSTAERKVKKEAASVIPVKRKLVKTMAVEAIISAFSPSGSSRTSDHSIGNGRGRATEGACTQLILDPSYSWGLGYLRRHDILWV